MSLTSVDAQVWNQIAQTQALKTEWARKAFRLDAEAMAELEDQEYREAAQKYGQTVAASLLDVKPLLLENVAISRFTQDQPMFREALPEVVSISEAVMLASKERPLSPLQQKLLRKLLQDALT